MQILSIRVVEKSERLSGRTGQFGSVQAQECLEIKIQACEEGIANADLNSESTFAK